MTPRRLTGREEAELDAAAQRWANAERTAAAHRAHLDRLVLELHDAGARITDIADVLKISRQSVYDAIERARDA